MDAMPHSPNHLLAALPTADFELLRPHLQTMQLVQEVVLVAAGEPLTHVFFPHSGVISLVVSLAAGEKIEVAMIGKDSVFGGSAALDGSISLTDAIVQLPGAASTLEVGRLRTAANESIAFARCLFGTSRRSSHRLSNPLHVMPLIRRSPGWRVGFYGCTIYRRKKRCR